MVVDRHHPGGIGHRAAILHPRHGDRDRWLLECDARRNGLGQDDRLHLPAEGWKTDGERRVPVAAFGV